MDTFLLRLHQQQIVHQCYAALLAGDYAQAALDTRNQQAFWAELQNLLTAIANISKACWGQGGKLTEQRRPLRESLQIPDSSPLANTDLRNHLEHYDERLDRWYATSTHHNYADFIIGPAETTFSGMDTTDIFRHFDPESGDVIFWGEHYSIPSLVTEIRRLLPIAEREARKPHWDPPSNPQPPERLLE